MSMVMRRLLAFALGMSVLLLSPVAEASHTSFQPGDIFVGVGGSKVQWRHGNGALNRELTTVASSPTTAGMAIDSGGKLYVTGYTSNAISRFTNTGNPDGTFGAGFSSHPESIAFSPRGFAVVGQERGNRDIIQLGASGQLLAQFDAPTDANKGTDRLDLASDQRTVLYVAEGKTVRGFDIVSNTAPDFDGQGSLAPGFWAVGLPGKAAVDLKILPTGGVLVADTEVIVRIPSPGAAPVTLDVPNQNCWSALALGTTTTSFLAADNCSKKVFSFDLATGVGTEMFTADRRSDIRGLAVFGGLTAATAGSDLSISKSDQPDPVQSAGTVTYHLAVTNAGPGAATGATVTDVLPPGTTLAAGSDPRCSAAGGTVTCSLGALAAGASDSVTLLVDVPSVTRATEIVNSATVSVIGDDSDPNPANNSDSETTTIGAPGGDAAATTCIPGETCIVTTEGAGLPNSTNNTVTLLEANIPPNVPPSVGSISEGVALFECFGGPNTSQQVDVNPPLGLTDPNNPIHVRIKIHPSSGVTTAPWPVCTQKDLDGNGTPETYQLPPCPPGGVPTLADIVNDPNQPVKMCVEKQQVLPNEIVQSHIEMLSFDPPFRH
jgi:uncharacterized repeat protein (TIGR01451 family)